jgi:hypothetical protein
MTKLELIREIKNHTDKNGNPYLYVNVSGGRVPLEQAPVSNLYAMYKRITTPKKVRREEQLQFNFA